MQHLPQMPGSGLFPSFPPRWMPSVGLPHWWDYAWWVAIILLIGGLWRTFTYLAIEVDLDHEEMASVSDHQTLGSS